ncbi:aminodeoxychorismate synthase component I [Clostridium cellulovorans]|nr:aminodeoxychorismate synthase component I [Clostridium cellulovorans]
MDITIEEFQSYLNPCEIYSVFSKEKNTIFLDSSKEDKELSRFSFIGVNPYKIYKTKGNKIYIDDKCYYGDPFLELEKLIKSMILDNQYGNMDLPLLCGCIGYFSYDIGRIIEVIEDTSEKDFDSYDSYFVFYDNIIIFDLINDKKYVTALGQSKDRKEAIAEIKEKILGAKGIKEEFQEKDQNTFYSNFTKEAYIDTIKKVKEYIANGDVYITNLTQRFWCYNNKEGFQLYKDLRSINKAPFASYLNLDDIQVISSSPERFIKIENNILETRPIKGTRPRGRNKEDDEKNRLELINSEKDKAELLMVTDLERNDLSKVCKVNTVNVQGLFKLEEYSTVFHLVSTITGELMDNVSAVKAMRECFPGGSITGTPKIRSMEIIEELEKVRRNLYTGAIGYFDLRGNCDFNIVIRTIIKKDNKAYFGVGGGITIESDEEMEYEETLDKAKALMKVL